MSEYDLALVLFQRTSRFSMSPNNNFQKKEMLNKILSNHARFSVRVRGVGMKKMFFLVGLATSFSFSAGAQTTAAPSPMTSPPPIAPSPPAAAITSICKDGTSFSGTTLKGPCIWNGGIDKKATAALSSTTSSSDSQAAKSPPPAQAAAGEGSGQVWANSSTKVYYCQGDRDYGETKKGEYMGESDAQAKGFHASRGKACAK